MWKVSFAIIFPGPETVEKSKKRWESGNCDKEGDGPTLKHGRCFPQSRS